MGIMSRAISRMRNIPPRAAKVPARAEATLPANPFGTAPHADRDTYLRLHAQARAISYPDIDAFERQQGYSIDRAWMEELALHTQVVIKSSQLNYQHGRVLYAALRKYCEQSTRNGPVTVLETGTARGFSSLCMARALADAGATGYVITIDRLPHNTPILWNCIDDHDGPKSRQQLLRGHEDLLRRIVFLQGSTHDQLERLGLAHIGFAFLDATHTYDDVLAEYAFVRERQQVGDIIVFDDVTPQKFDAVVKAIETIERDNLYVVERLQPSEQRGYAIAQRV